MALQPADPRREAPSQSPPPPSARTPAAPAMARGFLAWLAFLVATSWVGFALAELDFFSVPIAVAAGLVAAGGVAALLARDARSRLSGALAIGGVALAAAATLLPAVDTTLLSQDASIHRASGRWLGRTGSLAIPDPSLARMPEELRLGLFDMGAIGLTRVSLSRLPGGLVAPDLKETLVYPSFAHLLMVWIAIADRLGGDAAIALLAPLFAATAWWAIGLVALLAGSRASAIATIALLASLLPEHWFARFLMPEILAQALVWSGVAAARMAFAGGNGDDAHRPPGRGAASAAALAAGVLAGASLGIAGFARLEQLTIFVPCLLLARALLPSRLAVLPRGALVPFLLAAAHATAHLVWVPTDYGKRISRVLVDVVAVAWMALGGTPRRVLLALALLALVATGIGLFLRSIRRGLATRVFAGIAGAILFASIFGGRVPEELPALDWLAWYVPWPAWLAAGLGLLPPFRPTGLGLALFLEACDQIASPRVTTEQIWGARRLVSIVLPLVALAAGWAIARRDRPRAGLRRAAGAALVLLALALGARALAPLAGRSIQAGGAAFAREVGAAIPPGALVVLARPLDWLHVAPELWLDAGHEAIVARDGPAFPAALAALLAANPGREVYALSGEVAPPGAADRALEVLPELPPGWQPERLRELRWPARVLERTSDRPPAALLDLEARVTLYRLVRPPAEVKAPVEASRAPQAIPAPPEERRP